jgi:peptidoglycan/xylan/chitin deacetylase (PgdA/CDA1 family)
MRAIFTFHGVDESGSVLSVSPGELRGLVRAVRAAGHAIVPLAELVAEPARPDRVALTFDDGFRSVHDEALPLLREEGAPAALFLTTGFVGRDNGWPSQPAWAPRIPLVGWQEVEALAAAGWAIESHTASHPDLRGLSDAALEDELAGASEALARRLGRRPEAFAYPYGHCDARVAAAVARHHRIAATTRLAALGPSDDPLRLPRLDAFYLRAPRVQALFGGALFRGWIAARAALRGLRAR